MAAPAERRQRRKEVPEYLMKATRLRETAHSIADGAARDNILARIEELEKAQGSATFLQAYQKFMAAAADHMTIFAPLLPLLAKMLS
jgi:hypothetical protein